MVAGGDSILDSKPAPIEAPAPEEKVCLQGEADPETETNDQPSGSGPIETPSERVVTVEGEKMTDDEIEEAREKQKEPTLPLQPVLVSEGTARLEGHAGNCEKRHRRAGIDRSVRF